MANYNSKQTIKEQLLLESENQTIPDATIENYITLAHTQVFQNIKRTYERDNFTTSFNPDGSTNRNFFVILAPIHSVVAVLKNGTELTNTDYTLIYESTGINVPGANLGDVISILYVPEVYVLYERALAILALMTRFNPFTEDNNNSVYYHWKKVKDDCYKTIRSNFGTSLYSSQ
jgi:hypothetical protein